MKSSIKQLAAKLLALVMVMLCSLITVPAYAANPTSVEISKVTTQTPQNITDRTSDITLSVKGITPDTQKGKADVVLVLDRSGSMAGKSLVSLKAAANKFVDALTVPGSDNRIAVVSYSTSGVVNTAFSANQTTLNNAIAGIDANGGTNMHAGLRLAKELLMHQARTDANKTLVFMSDGEPTYHLEKEITEYRVVSSGDSYKIQHYGYYDQNGWGWYWQNGWTDAASIPESGTVGREPNGVAGNGAGGNFDQTSKTNAINEATAIKEAGIRVFSVGLGVNNNQFALDTLKQIATKTSDYYDSPKDSQLLDIFGQISGLVSLPISGNNAVVTDVIPSKFKCVGDSSGFVKKVDGVVVNQNSGEVTISNNILTWNLGEIPVGKTVTLTYTIKPDTAAMGNGYGAFFTNDSAKLTYKRQDTNADQTAVFDRPTALFAPVAIPETYEVSSGDVLSVPSGTGVLANDLNTLINEDLTRGFSGIKAVQADGGAAHGTLVLNSDGSFTYKSNTGYVGTDTFKYKLQVTATDKNSKQQVVIESQPVTVNVTVNDVTSVSAVSLYPKGQSSAASITVLAPKAAVPLVMQFTLDGHPKTLTFSLGGSLVKFDTNKYEDGSGNSVIKGTVASPSGFSGEARLNLATGEITVTPTTPTLAPGQYIINFPLAFKNLGNSESDRTLMVNRYVDDTGNGETLISNSLTFKFVNGDAIDVTSNNSYDLKPQSRSTAAAIDFTVKDGYNLNSLTLHGAIQSGLNVSTADDNKLYMQDASGNYVPVQGFTSSVSNSDFKVIPTNGVQSISSGKYRLYFAAQIDSSVTAKSSYIVNLNNYDAAILTGSTSQNTGVQTLTGKTVTFNFIPLNISNVKLYPEGQSDATSMTVLIPKAAAPLVMQFTLEGNSKILTFTLDGTLVGFDKNKYDDGSDNSVIKGTIVSPSGFSGEAKLDLVTGEITVTPTTSTLAPGEYIINFPLRFKNLESSESDRTLMVNGVGDTANSGISGSNSLTFKFVYGPKII